MEMVNNRPHNQYSMDHAALSPGARIKLLGLKSRAELNDTHATLIGPPKAQTGRYPVRLANGESILVKGDNFVAAPVSAAEGGPASVFGNVAANAGATTHEMTRAHLRSWLPRRSTSEDLLLRGILQDDPHSGESTPHEPHEPHEPPTSPSPPPSLPPPGAAGPAAAPAPTTLPPAPAAPAAPAAPPSAEEDEPLPGTLPSAPMWAPPAIGEATSALAWRRRGQGALGAAEAGDDEDEDEDAYDEEAEEAEALDELAVDAALLIAARRGASSGEAPVSPFSPVPPSDWRDDDADALAASAASCRWDGALAGGRVLECDATTAEGCARAREACARRVPIVLRGGARALLGTSLAAELSSLDGLRPHLRGREVTVLQSAPDAHQRFTYYFDEKVG